MDDGHCRRCGHDYHLYICVRLSVARARVRLRLIGKWRQQETILTDINENQHHSRPSRYTVMIAIGVVLGVGVIAYWAEISAFAHIPQIKHALGL